MTATDTQILNAAKDSLLRILETDTSSWGEGERNQSQLEINRLETLIANYEKKIASASGRRLHMPMRRVNA
jgi:hypothetical protein